LIAVLRAAVISAVISLLSPLFSRCSRDRGAAGKPRKASHFWACEEILLSHQQNPFPRLNRRLCVGAHPRFDGADRGGQSRVAT
jgi:hypothetical protein